MKRKRSHGTATVCMVILMSLFLLVPIYSIIGSKSQNDDSGEVGFPYSIYEKILQNDLICTIFGIEKDSDVAESESAAK